MNAAHWHLALNHFPVVGAWFATGLLAFAWWRRNDELIRVALGVFVVVAATVVPVYLSGLATETLMMGEPGISDDMVEAHRAAALIGLVAMIVLGVAALAMFLVLRKAEATPRGWVAIFLALAVALSGWMGWVANLGGVIHHPEIRPANSAQKSE